MANEPEEITKKGCAKGAIYFFGALFLVSIFTIVVQLLFGSTSQEEIGSMRVMFWLFIVSIVLFALLGGRFSDFLKKNGKE